MSDETPKANKGREALQKLLAAQARRFQPKVPLVPKGLGRYTARDLYQQFLQVDVDLKGMVASGWGDKGWKKSANLYFSFTEVIWDAVNAGVNVSASVQTGERLMLIIHHEAPRALPPPAPNQAGAWTTDSPICLMSLAGVSKQISGSVDASFGPKKVLGKRQVTPSVAGKSGAELPLSVGVVATAGAGVEVTHFQGRDPAPGWYPRAFDDVLQKDFERCLGEGSKDATKDEIREWLQGVIRKLYGALGDEIPEEKIKKFQAGYMRSLQLAMAEDKAEAAEEAKAGEAKREAIEQEVAQAKAALDKEEPGVEESVKGAWKALKRGFLGLVKDAASFDPKEKIEGAFTALAGAPAKLQALLWSIRPLLPKGNKSADLAKILNQVLTIIEPLPPLPPLTTPSGQPSQAELEYKAIAEAIDEIRAEARWYLQRLYNVNVQSKDLPVKTGARPPTDKTAWAYLCKLHTISAIPKAGAGISASVTLPVAKAGLSASVKYVRSRYQSFVPGDADGQTQLLVFTQDARLWYRCVEVKAECALPFVADPKDPLYVKDLNGAFGLYALTYCTVGAYWRYPSDAAATSATAEPGSGVSFGCSVAVKDLVVATEEVIRTNNAPKEYKVLIDQIAAILHVPDWVVCDLLRLSDFQSISPASFPYSSVLIEANYALPAGTSVPLKDATIKKSVTAKEEVVGLEPKNLLQPKGGDIASFIAGVEKTIGDAAFPAELHSALESLRIRYRIADSVTSSTTYVKLGLIIKKSHGFELSKVSAASTEGVVDLFVLPVSQRTWDLSEAERMQRAVPPATLLHH